MINDVDDSLRQLLVSELAKLPERGALSDLKVLFTSPATGTGGASRCIRLYLHDIRENLQQREEVYRVVRKPDDREMAGRPRSPVYLDLSYLLTVEANGDVAEEHRLLAEVLAVLLRNDPVPAEYFQGELAYQSPGAMRLVVATAEHPSHANLASLWQSLGVPTRPAITLVATIQFNPFTPKWTRVVREVLFGMHSSANPHDRHHDFELLSMNVSVAGIAVAAGRDIPLQGVSVRVAQTDFAHLTNDQGVFFITNLPPGQYTLIASRHGFSSQEKQFLVKAQGRADRLDPLVIELEPMSAEAWKTVNALTDETTPTISRLLESDRQQRMTVRGRIAYQDGRPAAFIPLRLGTRRTVTDETGFYLFSEMRFTNEQIVAELPGQGEVLLQQERGGESVVELTSAEAVTAQHRPARGAKP